MDERVVFKRLRLPDTYRVDVYPASPTNAYHIVRYKMHTIARLYTIRNYTQRTTEYRVAFNDKPDVLYTGYDPQELMMRVVSAHRVMGHD